METDLEVRARAEMKKFFEKTSNTPHKDEFVQFVVEFATDFGFRCVGKVVTGEVARTAVERAARGEP